MRSGRVIVWVAAVLVCVPAARATGAGTTVARAAGAGQSCAGPPTVSALNQYCENIPAATGGRPPLPGSPALAGSLPRSIVRQLLRAGPQSTRRKLLRLPAGIPPVAPGGAGTAEPWSLSLPLIVAVIAVALGLTAAAATRRRRRPRPT